MGIIGVLSIAQMRGMGGRGLAVLFSSADRPHDSTDPTHELQTPSPLIEKCTLFWIVYSHVNRFERVEVSGFGAELFCLVGGGD